MRLVQSKSKIWLRRLFCLLCSLVLVLTAGVSSAFVAEAKSRSELESEKSKIQSRINSTQSKLNSLSKQKKDTQEYINTLQEKISLLQDKISNLESDKSALQSEIDATQAKIEKTAADIEETQRQIDQKQKEFDATYAEYCQRLRAMYISGSASTLEVLLTCSDLSSLLTRSEMIKSVSQQDSATLDSLMKKMEEIEAQKQKLEEKRNQLNADKKSLETDKAALQKNINDISSTKRIWTARPQSAMPKCASSPSRAPSIRKPLRRIKSSCSRCKMISEPPLPLPVRTAPAASAVLTAPATVGCAILRTAAPFLPGIPTTPAVVTTGALISRYPPAPMCMQPPAAR